jgi:hypothetical protein
MPQSGVAVPTEQAAPRGHRPSQPEPRTQRDGVQSRPRPTPTAGAPAASHGGAGVPGRRTVTIRGVGAEAWAVRSSSRSRASSSTPRSAGPRRRPRAHERSGFRPDRVAMWAVLLGVVLVLVAATSSHAAPLRSAINPSSLAGRASEFHGASPPAAPLSSTAPVRRPRL